MGKMFKGTKMPNTMKVLLCEDITKLGWLGDVVEVNVGYARNYLLPQGKAKIATKASIRAIAEEKAQRAEQRIQDSRRLENAAKAVEGAEAVPVVPPVAEPTPAAEEPTAEEAAAEEALVAPLAAQEIEDEAWRFTLG